MPKVNTRFGNALSAALVLGLSLMLFAVVGETMATGEATSVVQRAKPVVVSDFESEMEEAIIRATLVEAHEAEWRSPVGARATTDATKSLIPSQASGRATGDDCTDPIVVNLGLSDLPYTLTSQYTCGRVNDYDNTCLGSFDGGEDIIYELNPSENFHVSITLDPKGTAYTGILIDPACPNSGDCMAQSRSSAVATHGLVNVPLTAGTSYYIMVDTWPDPACIPDFDLTFEVFEPSSGDNCTDPAIVKIPEDLTGGPNFNAYIDEGQTTCGRGNDYENTCLDEWDSGEDIIYQLNVSQAIDVDIFLDPGPTLWTGILIDDNCPPDETCIQYSVIGSGPHGLYDVSLEPGIYYIMVDTYAYPDCIPAFSLTIQPVGGGPVNDNWENCMAIEDVVDLPFSTAMATPDGPGGCITSPNIWYCYTASCTGFATISLCGSSYDTKLAVYDGTDPFYDPLLGCNDNSEACGEFSQQSQLEIEVVQNNVYLIGVGGWGDHTGEGILNVSCAVPPENDNCEDVTPVLLADGVPVTFVGDNTNASHQCDFFDGAHVWHAFTLDTTMIVTLDYCTTDPAFSNAWLNLTDCPCTEVNFVGEYNFDDCGDGNVTVTWDFLEAGTYYYPVMLDDGAEGPYTIHVVGQAVAVYCKANGGCDNEFISRVAVGDIDNISNCDGDGYGDFTNLSTTMETAVGYPITVEIGNGIVGDIGVVWVDWDQNYKFEIDEEVELDVFSGPGPYTGSVIPPWNAAGGATTMRVRVNCLSYPPPCGTTSSGEVEDYTINVNVIYLCGDADSNGMVNISDAVYLISYIFGDGPAPAPLESGNVNCDEIVNISDAVYIITYIFGGGPEPCADCP